ncbi:hypothetical protein LOK74_18035 [Brevibacillus humidisoli]|uniref:hypothetical protein n=1 Tax=Brevibacillus humidisoli TaxID=2895522 RepID=UPI001E4FB536|nr:hypothetical protein [Brevibacillus humidisoli]UFJ39931.1 hypothetical protein LOK74_18035 [Brevibacillus humidisoli]
MSEEKLLQEFAQSARQMVEREYPYRHDRLETKVLARMQGKNLHQQWKKMAWSASFAACFAMLLYGITPIDPIISGKRTANHQEASFEWLVPDVGFSNAIYHGYKILPEIRTEQSGFTIQVKDIMVDQLRMGYTVLLSGDEIEAIAQQPEEAKREAIYAGLTTEPNLKISGGSESSDYQLINGKHYLIKKAIFTLKEGEIKNILSKPQPAISLLIKDMRADQKQVANVPVSLPVDIAQSEKVIQSATTAKPQLGTQDVLRNLRVNEIKAYPTVMRIKMEAELAEGYSLRGLRNVEVVDDHRKEYTRVIVTPSVSVQQQGENAVYYLDMMPSLYFGRAPQELSLRFDGIEAVQEITSSFTLKPNGEPHEVTLGSKKIRILRAYYENDQLHLEFPGEAKSEETHFSIEGVPLGEETFDSESQTFTRSIAVPEKETYKIDVVRYEQEQINIKGFVPIRDGKE